MAELKLRPQQEKVIDEVAEAFRAGYRRILVSCMCSFGKTEVAAAMLDKTRQNNRRGIFVADRIALCDQASERLSKYDIPHGVFQGSGHPKYAPSENIQVGSVQTLIRRRVDPFHLYMHDEAHELKAWSKRELESGTGRHIGLTATGFVKGLGNYFDCIVNGPTANQMIADGWLVPLKIYSCKEADMSEVPLTSDGEWEEKAAEKEVLSITGDIVDNYLANGNDEKFICFAWNIKHAKELQAQFISAGVNVCTYTADDDGDDKRDIVQEFDKDDSSIRGLISVAALVKGFSVDSVKLLILARPLRRSLADLIQMLGRVMRIYPGKDVGRVFDHAGNCARFWHRLRYFFEHGLTKLNKGEKEQTEKEAQEAAEKPEPDPIKCPECGHMHLPMPVCENCGFEFPRHANVLCLPGKLSEMRSFASTNSRFTQDTLWPQVVDFVMKERKKTTDPAKQQAMAQGIYKDLTGGFAKMRFESTNPVDCTDQVRGMIRHLTIRHIKSKAKKKKA